MSIARFREYLTVLFVFTLFLFSPIVTVTLVLLLAWRWSLPGTLLLCLLYGCWMFYDRHRDSRGGRWSDQLRRSSIGSYFTSYFPMSLIKTAELDARRNYIFGFHPHGAFSFGALGNFGTDTTGFSTLFPNLRPHLMLLHLQFLFPFTREILLRLGACCVSKESCEYFLRENQGTGHALVIIVGGAREMYLTRPETMKLYLRRRKGFVTLALKHGYDQHSMSSLRFTFSVRVFSASLVPVISFGENELYTRPTCSGWVPNGLPWGRFIFGHVPNRRPLFTVGTLNALLTC